MNDQNFSNKPSDHDPMPEGEEKAPPYTHAMAVVRWIILGGVALFALVMLLSYFNALPLARKTGNAVQYHCPMHPTYISSQPGECPICGMTLVPMKNAADTLTISGSENMSETTATRTKPGDYACPMHPEVVSHEPGKCPRCGMDLVQIPTSFKQGPAKAGQYYCPMHTYVVSDSSGKCPLCDMNLVMAAADQSSSGQSTDSMPGKGRWQARARPDQENNMVGMDMGEAPVPGLVPIMLDPKRLQLINVRTETIEKRSLESTLRLVGFITADETKIANLNVRTSGWVQKLIVDQTGQAVTQGQSLLTIYSPDLYQAQQDFLTALTAAKPGTGDSLLAVTRNQILDAARDRLRLLGMTSREIGQIEAGGDVSSEVSLRSPVTGIVLGKAVLNGQYITPGQNLFTVADLRSIWVLADVYESDLSRLKVGQPVQMQLTAYPGEIYEGKVSFIYPTVSEQTRTLKVRMEFANPDMKLRPGMYSDVTVDVGNGNRVLAAPTDAVMRGGDISYAFVMHEGGHFEPRLLKTGQSTDDFIEVLSGLHEGDRVITSANFLIDSESRLKAAISGMGGAPAGEHTGHEI